MRIAQRRSPARPAPAPAAAASRRLRPGRAGQADALLCQFDLKAARAGYLPRWAPARATSPCCAGAPVIDPSWAETATGERRRRLRGAAVGHAREAVKTRRTARGPPRAGGRAGPAGAQGRAKTQLSLSQRDQERGGPGAGDRPDAWGGPGTCWPAGTASSPSLNFFERTAANTVLGGLPKGATMENAVAHLQKAIALEPDYVNHHLELGRTFMQLERKAKARAELERAVALPPEPGRSTPSTRRRPAVAGEAQ